MPNLRTVLLAVLVSALALAPTACASVAAPADAPEPSAEEVFRAAGVNPDEGPALVAQLIKLLGEEPGVLDVWIPALREAEYRGMCNRLAGLGYFDEWGKVRVDRKKVADELMAELKSRRLKDPRRLAEAILRRLEQLGEPGDLGHLLSARQSSLRTSLGTCKVDATIIGILARHDADKIAGAKDLNVNILAPLLRHLEPEKAGSLAQRFLKLVEQDAGAGRATILRTRLWLAWNLSHADPAKALDLFAQGLESRDPGLRLFAGMGIARISDNDIPCRLTAPVGQTIEARKQWLAAAKPRKPRDWSFPAPLSLPLVKEQRGTRVDLVWLGPDGAIVREQTDVWPAVRQVLPDGTFYSRATALGENASAMTSPEGETLLRFEGVGFGWLSLEPHGGFWTPRRDERRDEAIECGPTGEMLWACGARACFVAGAGRGRVLVVEYGKVKVVNLRGDELWSVKDKLDDPRWACMLDGDTILISCTKDLVIHHRTKGEIRRLKEFVSLGPVRYHPEKPWMIFDAGSSSVVLYDPKDDTRITKRIGWTNDDPPCWSKWLGKGQSGSPE